MEKFILYIEWPSYLLQIWPQDQNDATKTIPEQSYDPSKSHKSNLVLNFWPRL